MANISNRSPWQVKLPGKPAAKFRLKSQALAHLGREGYGDPQKLPKGSLKQLETAFEVQIKLKDNDGRVVSRSATLDTRAQAERWAKEQEDSIIKMRDTHGGFAPEFETISLGAALDRFHKQHYAGKASEKEINSRLPQLKEWLGGHRRFRDLKKKDFIHLREKLKELRYSESSVRNFFTILTSLYKHAANEWLWPVDNPVSGIKLDKPRNAIQRYWQGDEKDRLMRSIELHHPWLKPIVQLSLAIAFRRGEIVQGPKDKSTGDQKGGLTWEDVDWDAGLIRLRQEKNDHTKKATEYSGRIVPIPPEIFDDFKKIYEQSTTKSGLIFQATTNSVSQAFKSACDKAEPPIKNLTFHSLRKIATRDLSRRVSNAMELSRLSGHKNIEILNKRYYDVSAEDLRDKLLETAGSIKQRGLSILIKNLGQSEAKQFIKEIRSLPSDDEVFD